MTFPAIILTIHEGIVADGVERPVFLGAHATRRVLTFVTRPSIRMRALLTEPLLHVDRTKASYVLGGLTCPARVLVQMRTHDQ